MKKLSIRLLTFIMSLTLLITSLPAAAFHNPEQVSAAVTPSLTLSDHYIKATEAPTIKWAGIPLSGISKIEYRIAAYSHSTGDTSKTNTVGETSLGKPTKSEGERAISKRANGCYRVYMWVMYKENLRYKASTILHVDSTAPGISSLEISPKTSAYSNIYPLFNKTTKEITETHLRSIEYSVDGAAWKSFGSVTTVSSLTLPAGSLGNSGIKKINIRMTDQSANISTKGPYTYYFDKDAPERGKTFLKSNGTAISSSWTKEKNPEICFSGIKDAVSGVNILGAAPATAATAGVTYAITPSSVNTAPIAGQFKLGTSFAITGDNANGYTGSLKFTQTGTASVPADINLPDGEYNIFVKFKDKAGNERIVKLPYKKDTTPPEAKIIPKDLAGKEITELYDIVQILSSISDKSSGIARAKAEIYLGANKVYDLFSDRTTSTISNFDTTKLVNEDYKIKLIVSDKAGNSTEDKPVKAEKSVKVDNKIRNLYLSPKKTLASPIKVSWEYFEPEEKLETSPKLEKIQYKFEGAASWEE
ncbi:MAG: hypothetical protein ACRCUS_10125, partial [Anaerovoracaceae bacterium]